MISVRLAGQLAECLYMAKNFKAAIFLDTLDMINVKLCMMVVLFELYPFISLSVTLIVIKVHSSVKEF